MKRLAWISFVLLFSAIVRGQSLPFPGPGGVAAAPVGYSYQRTITINYTEIGSSNLTNFPLLIDGTYSYLATVANGGRVQNFYGYDIVFGSNSGCTSLLSWEQESWNASSGAVIYWVQVPTVSYTTNTVIYMCYGNSSISSFQGGATGAAWNDGYFQGVYHLSNGTSPEATDSTANGNNGTLEGSLTEATGIIDGAANFNSNYIQLPTNFSITISTAFTWSAWIYWENTTGTSSPVFGNANLSGTAAGVWLLLDWLGATQFYLIDSTGGTYINVGLSELSSSTWYRIVATYDGSGSHNGMNIYVNGALPSQSRNGTFSGTLPITNFRIGADTGGNYRWQGIQDEVNVAVGVARSASWILADYNNQSSPSTFYTVGSEQAI
jgi:hypothetical protein